MLISKDTVDDITATVVSANMLSQDIINIINSVLEKLVQESKNEKSFKIFKITQLSAQHT